MQTKQIANLLTQALEKVRSKGQANDESKLERQQ